MSAPKASSIDRMQAACSSAVRLTLAMSLVVVGCLAAAAELCSSLSMSGAM